MRLLNFFGVQTAAALAMTFLVANVAAFPSDTTERLQYKEAAELPMQLIRWTEQTLAESGLFIERPLVQLDRAIGPSRGKLEINWLNPPGTGSTAGLPIRLELRTLDALGALQIRQVTVIGRLKRDALVATRSMPRGHSLSCGDLRLERRDVRPGRDDALPVPCDLTLGLALRRPLSTGDVVRSTDIGEKPAVAEMTPVSIRVKVGAVDISSNGVALANAQVGEQVKVRSNLSRQILLARVVGPQSVVVDEGDLR